MEIYKIYPRGFGANTYILTQDNRTAVVIDPAQEQVIKKLQELGLRAEYVLLTHCHFDHVAGVAALQKEGAKVFCSAKEKPLIHTRADLFELFGAPREPFFYTVDGTLEDNEECDFCGIRIKTLVTSGHTAGSCCYEILENDGGRYLFTGDTLFENSIGRTDFPTGDLGQLRQSLKRLVSLPQDYVLHSGHGEQTTLSTERKHNPFLIDL